MKESTNNQAPSSKEVPSTNIWRAVWPRNERDEEIGYFAGDRDVIEKFLVLCGHAIVRLEPVRLRTITGYEVRRFGELKDALSKADDDVRIYRQTAGFSP